MRPGATTLTRPPRRAASRAACRINPICAAFEVSYDGMPLPGRSPAIDEISTDDEPSGINGIAVFSDRKCDRTLTAKTRSHSSADVPSRPRPLPMPTLSTSASSPPSVSAAHSTPPAVASASAASTESAWAVPPASATSRTVSCAAASSTSVTATAAPSCAASTAIARPLPIGAFGSSVRRVPPPTTSNRRPASRPLMPSSREERGEQSWHRPAIRACPARARHRRC